MPTEKPPQPKVIPTETPLESDPLAKVYAQQEKKLRPKTIKKGLALFLTIILIVGLGWVIYQLYGFWRNSSSTPVPVAPTPTPAGRVIIGPVNRYATHSATLKIERMITESENAFKNIKFREESYLPPKIDLDVSL